MALSLRLWFCTNVHADGRLSNDSIERTSSKLTRRRSALSCCSTACVDDCSSNSARRAVASCCFTFRSISRKAVRLMAKHSNEKERSAVKATRDMHTSAMDLMLRKSCTIETCSRCRTVLFVLVTMLLDCHLVAHLRHGGFFNRKVYTFILLPPPVQRISSASRRSSMARWMRTEVD